MISGEEMTTKMGILLHEKSTDVAIIAQREANTTFLLFRGVQKAFFDGIAPFYTNLSAKNEFYTKKYL